MKPLVKAIIILPGTVVFLMPAALLFVSRISVHQDVLSDNSFLIAASVPVFVIGLWLAVSTVRLFATVGRGTPAPWAPPKRLIVEGPYRYVRNPMIAGVLCVLMGEALLFASGWIFVWGVMFFVINTFYFLLSEEKALALRFGAEYGEYKKHVPRWLPRLTPWKR